MTTLRSGNYSLSFRESQNGYGLYVLQDGRETPVFVNPAPCYLYIKSPTTAPLTYAAAYDSVTEAEGGIRAQGSVETAAGSVFAVCDQYTAGAENGFYLHRTVTIEKATAADRGFATKISLEVPGAHTLNDINCFAPGAWYQKNEFVPPHFIGYNKNIQYHWMYETQYALPMFAVQDIASGDTACISRLHADMGPRDYTTRLHDAMVDEHITFGSIGVSTDSAISLDYIYPGARGTSTRKLPDGFPLEHIYSNEFHPVRTGGGDSYAVSLDFLNCGDFPTMMKTLWRSVYERIDEPIVPLDNELLYKNAMVTLRDQTNCYEDSWGLPFASMLPSGEPMKVAYQFGFVGQQPNIGYQLLRYGAIYEDSEALEKGRNVIQFWVDRSLTEWGAPHIWYNPEFHDFEDRPFWIRMIGDGMEGILDAYVFEKKHGNDHPDWLAYCKTVADWLVRAQNEDGSWYRSYDAEGKMLMDSKANTSNVIRFLVQLAIVTGADSYRDAALKAGVWSLEHITRYMEYRGGTCDNSDIYDKESGIYAIFGYLALYDLTKEDRWLKAACEAADYVETWTYAWSFPMNVPYPANPLAQRNLSGQSLIATGHSGADVYMASCPYLYYRLYLLTDDAHYLHFARFIHHNSKQSTDYDGSCGYAFPGMSHESGSLYMQEYQGQYHWLPWCTYVQVDPISRIYDTFGTYEIDDAEKLPLEERRARNDIYASYWL